MEDFDRHSHWENIYKSRPPDQLSWYQLDPIPSLDFIKQLNIPLTAKIIDIGGGDSLLVDHLLELGYRDISVLDISETSLQRAQERLGNNSVKVKWIVADAATFRPVEQYDLWHDRAAFHFLTDEKEIENYIDTLQRSLRPGGILVLGTFSDQGPKKCSGLDVKQYSEFSMSQKLKRFFSKIKCITVDHTTPFKTVQNFIFCSFRRFETKEL